MEALIYLLKVALISSVLFGYYLLALRNNLYHSYNRFFLLFILFVSPILPFITINFWEQQNDAKPIPLKLIQSVSNSDEWLQEVIINTGNNKPIVNTHFVMLGICIFISALLLLRFALSILTIYKLKKQSPSIAFKNILLIFTENPSAPFTFLRNIFWRNSIDIQTPEGNRILQHELVHVTENHTYDKLFVNIVLAFLWPNPIFWLIRRELNMIHEFIADNKTIQNGDTSMLAQLILQTSIPTKQNILTSTFFYSPIKRRIAMIKKQFSNPKVGYAGRILALPLMVLVFAAFTLKQKAIPMHTLPPGKTFTILIDAGHGGEDMGAMAEDKQIEKNLTLALAQSVLQQNDEPNLKILFTRDSDKSLDVKSRAEMATSMNADLFVSIHMEATATQNNTKESGLSVWVANSENERTQKSKALASAILENFSKGYSIGISKANPQKRQKPIWVLEATSCPAVLVEAGYISNTENVTYLSSKEGQTIFAKKLLGSIKAYFNQTEKTISIEADKIFINPDSEKPGATAENSDIQRQTIISNLKGEIQYNNLLESKVLYVINGKEYNSAVLANKQIISERAKIYEMNSAEALKKYGEKARFGVYEFYNAKIIDQPDERNTLRFSADSITMKGTNFNSPTSANVTDNALFVIDGEKYSKQQASKILQSKDITSINIYTADEAIKLFGTDGKYGVIEILTKSGIAKQRDEKPIRVSGEVKYPGIYAYKANMTLQTVLDAAGGLLPNSGFISIERQGGDPSRIELLQYHVDKSAIGFVDFRSVQIQPGDAIAAKVKTNDFIKPNDLITINLKTDNEEVLTKYKVAEDGSIVTKNIGKIYFNLKDYENVAKLVVDKFSDNIQEGSTIEVIINEKYKFKETVRGANNLVFNIAESEAYFPGGESAWANYLATALRNFDPTKYGAKRGRYQVIIKFMVLRDGTVAEVTPLTNFGFKMEEKAVELIKRGPKWMPAMQNGKAVSAVRKQPITFVVAEE